MSDVNFYPNGREAKLVITEKAPLPQATGDQVDAWERIDILKGIQVALQELPCRLKHQRFVALQSALQRAVDEAREDLPPPCAIFPRPPMGAAEFFERAAQKVRSLVGHTEPGQG